MKTSNESSVMRSGRHVLMQTISAAAVVAVLAQAPAEAQENNGPVKVYLQFNAGESFGDDQAWVQSGRAAAFSSIEPDFFLGGEVGLTVPVDVLLPGAAPGWDIGIFASMDLSDNARARAGSTGYYSFGSVFNVLGGNYAGYYSSGNVRHNEDHVMVDFQAQRDVGIGGGMDLTVFGGLRFAHFSATTNTAFLYYGDGVGNMNENRQSEFTGAGPLIGGNVSVPVMQNVSIDASATGAVLFGEKDLSVVAVNTFGSTVVTNISDSDILPIAEGSVALSFTHPGTGVVVSGGVQAKALFGVYNQRTLVSINGQFDGDEDGNRFTVGPFLRITAPFGGGG